MKTGFAFWKIKDNDMSAAFAPFIFLKVKGKRIEFKKQNGKNRQKPTQHLPLLAVFLVEEAKKMENIGIFWENLAIFFEKNPT